MNSDGNDCFNGQDIWEGTELYLFLIFFRTQWKFLLHFLTLASSAYEIENSVVNEWRRLRTAIGSGGFPNSDAAP
jgi:hypothetical protein